MSEIAEQSLTEVKPPVETVDILDAIRPENAGTGEPTLLYKELGAAAIKYPLQERERAAAFWDAEPGSLEEIFKARQLSFQYLIQTAEKSVSAPTESAHDIWATRYTEGSIELYGQPDAQEAVRLMRNEFDMIIQNFNNPAISFPDRNLLIRTYGNILADARGLEISVNAEQDPRELAAIKALGEVIREKYQPLFDLVDTNKKAYNPEELQTVFKAAYKWLEKNDDPVWSEWTAPIVEGTHITTYSKQQAIKIGESRKDASPDDAIALIAHEVLVHALRGKNGKQTKDAKLGTGYAEYMTAEEGLGKLFEHAVIGRLPTESADKYLNFALALGTVNRKQHSRQEVADISYARSLIRAQIAGKPVDEEELHTNTWKGVDRIFRGGRGDEFGTRHAVFTNDLHYYNGYKKMSSYLADQMEAGKSAEDILAYLSQGKFDPTDDSHLARLKLALA